jgi:hypothetical protein
VSIKRAIQGFISSTVYTCVQVLEIRNRTATPCHFFNEPRVLPGTKEIVSNHCIV